MNKHTQEVSDFMKTSGISGRPTKSRVVAKFENRYGEEKSSI